MEGNISSLICTSYGKDCNPLSLSMSRGLMRVAATRIFNVPEQSFMEIISNAVDAISDEKIGKFGMGFYSILYWVYTDPIAFINIRTQSYNILIKSGVNGPTYKITQILPVKGTTVTINANFNSKELSNQISRFVYNKNASISHDLHDGEEEYIIFVGEGRKTVSVSERGRSVTIKDDGPGMDYNTIMSSLLIPSVSSKNRPSLPYNLDFSMSDKKGGYFNIIVGGVVIYRSRSNNPNYDQFCVNLPASTSLPVSRDDVMYDRDVSISLSKQLMGLASKFIKEGDVSNFILQLTNYSMYTSHREGKKLVNKVISYIQDYPNIVPVQLNSDIHIFCKKMLPNLRTVVFPTDHLGVSAFKTENSLDKYLSDMSIKKDIFNHKKVIHYEGPTINLSKYLITDTTNRNWVSNIMATNSVVTLTPFSNNVSSTIDYVDLVANTFNTTTSNCDVQSGIRLIVKQSAEMVKALLPKHYKDYMITFSDTLSRVKYNFSYGSTNSILFNDKSSNGTMTLYPKVTDYKAYESHTIECLYFFLEAIELNVTGGYSWYPNIWGFLPIDMDEDLESFRRYMLNGLSLCLNPAEKLVFYYIMRKNDVMPKAGISEFLVREIQRFGGNDLSTLVINNARMYVMSSDLFTSVINPVENSLKLYTRAFEPVLTDLCSVQLRSVTANQMINYIYSNGDISSIFSGAATMGKKTPLQTISIVVNDGTTKSYGSASIAELVQNSIDASKVSGTKTPINVNIGEDGFSIEDGVGIKDIIYLLIPFLSNKDVNDTKVTGEMGTGFFNVYRECKAVTISTTYNGVGTYIEGYPVIEGDKVVDILYKYYISDTDLPNNTNISVHLPEDSNKRVKALTDVYIYLKNYIVYTPFPVTINDEYSSKKKTLVYSSEIGQIYYTEESTIPSFVTTNNIPFTDLKGFVQNYYGFNRDFMNYCSLRIIVNINKEYYTPTQSRTKVSTKDDGMFTKFLNDGIHLAILRIYASKGYSNPDEILLYSSSSSEISQLLINEKDPYLIIENYHNSIIEGKISSVINKMIHSKKRNSDFKTSDITDTWLTDKIIKPKAVDSGYLVKGKKKKDKSKKSKAYSVKILQDVVDRYWKILDKSDKWSGKLPTSKPPKVLFKSKTKDHGYYNPKSHKIVLSEGKVKGDDVMSSLEEYTQLFATNKLEATRMMRTNHILKTLFSPCIPATTLLHELLHAVSSDDHYGYHGNPNFTVNGENHTFDGTASALYSLTVNGGLWE